MNGWPGSSLLALALFGAATLCQAAPSGEGVGAAPARRTAIVLHAQGHELHGWLDDSVTARDFIKTLPRTLPMKRWGGREFYGKPGAQLRVAGPTQHGFTNGDIGYWVPGGSFAIFYDDRQSQDIDDLIVIGKVSAGLEWFRRFDDTIELSIELADSPLP